MSINHGNLGCELSKLIGRKVRHERARRNLTQDDLAHEMGTCRENISRIELGKNDLKLSTLSRLAKTLNVSVVSLFIE